MSTTQPASGPRPSPQAAYTRWMDACIAAGWRVEPAAERVPVRDGWALHPAEARLLVARFVGS